MAVVLTGTETGASTIMECVLAASKLTAPFFSWVSIALGAVFVLRLLTKYVYYAIKFKEKVEAHVKEMHFWDEST